MIEECNPGFVYRVAVLAVPRDTERQKPRLSNQLELSLPLETDAIMLPPAESRQLDPDMYKEYIEIREGCGYLPGEEAGKRAMKSYSFFLNSAETIFVSFFKRS